MIHPCIQYWLGLAYARRKLIADTVEELLGTRRVFLLRDAQDMIAAARQGAAIPLTMHSRYPESDLRFAAMVLSQKLGCGVIMVPLDEVRDWAHIEPMDE